MKTLDDLVKSGVNCFVPDNHEPFVAPLPIEMDGMDFAERAQCEKIPDVYRKFPLLNFDAIRDQTYLDRKYEAYLPTFVLIDIESKSRQLKIGSGVTINSNLPAFYFAYISYLRDFCNNLADGMVPSSPVERRLLKRQLLFSVNGNANDLRGNKREVFRVLEIIESNRFYSKPRLDIGLIFDFKGTVPNKTRAKYHETRQLFDQMFLICDATDQWSMEINYTPPPKVDPLLVGVRQFSDRFYMFLVDQFDLTFKENYLTKEFTS